MLMSRKTLLITVVVVAVAGAGAWYAVRAGLFTDDTPTRPPTAEELRRMDEIEKSSATIAPNAKAGAGVVPPGTMPRTPEPTPDATSTGTSTETAE